MKKTFKIRITVVCVLICVCFIAITIALLPNYKHNDALIQLYTNNSDVFNNYVNSADLRAAVEDNPSESTEEGFDDSDKMDNEAADMPVPDYLKNLSVLRMEITDFGIFFETDTSHYCYTGLYYSFDDDYAQSIPFFGFEGDDFHIEKDTIYVKGKMNNGEDWYMTEKIADNWYYYEVHL